MIVACYRGFRCKCVAMKVLRDAEIQGECELCYEICMIRCGSSSVCSGWQCEYADITVGPVGL